MGYICSLIDAKNDNVYYALWDNIQGTYQQIGQYLTENINLITEILKDCNKPIFFVGNGSKVYESVLKSSLNEKAIFSDQVNLHKLNAISIGNAAFSLYQNQDSNLNKSLSPFYLRKSSAERELEEKQHGCNH